MAAAFKPPPGCFDKTPAARPRTAIEMTDLPNLAVRMRSQTISIGSLGSSVFAFAKFWTGLVVVHEATGPASTCAGVTCAIVFCDILLLSRKCAGIMAACCLLSSKLCKLQQTANKRYMHPTTSLTPNYCKLMLEIVYIFKNNKTHF